MVLVKWAFLLRRETILREDATFYDFVPYKYGPFSFALYRELASLRDNGYVALGDERVAALPTAQSCVAGLPENARDAVRSVLARYGKTLQSDLVGDIYARYPWYAGKSELKDLVPLDIPKAPTADLAVYTVGYEGKSVDSFFNGLLRRGVHAILDVRANPVSRKYGFAKRSLDDIAGKLGLCYHHLPELGIPSSERRDVADPQAYQRLFDRYEKEILPKVGHALEQLVQLLRQRPSALLCMEKDAASCHRSRLAEAAAAMGGLQVIHL
jgi:uncharacterized protein (DUF488 family)